MLRNMSQAKEWSIGFLSAQLFELEQKADQKLYEKTQPVNAGKGFIARNESSRTECFVDILSDQMLTLENMFRERLQFPHKVLVD